MKFVSRLARHNPLSVYFAEKTALFFHTISGKLTEFFKQSIQLILYPNYNRNIGIKINIANFHKFLRLSLLPLLKLIETELPINASANEPIIGSEDDLMAVRGQAIIWSNAYLSCI